MTTREAARGALYAQLEDTIGRDHAGTLMSHLPLIRADEVATKGDVLGIRTDMSGLRTELKTEMSGLRTELKTEISELRGELRTDMSGLRTELRTEMTSLRGELRTEISELRGEMTELRRQFGALGESILKVQANNPRLIVWMTGIYAGVVILIMSIFEFMR